jgi:pimeloyl-[acyl-carrier protein] methyl ester esterase
LPDNITRLILLPGMHGTGELFSEFTRIMPEPKQIQALCYPADANLSYQQLLAMVQSMVPESEPYFLLAESYSTPLAIEFAATNPPNLKGLILCAGFASSPLTGPRSFLALLLAPLLFRMRIPPAAMNHFLIGPNTPESLQVAVRAAISSVKPGVMIRRLRDVLRCDMLQALSQVSAPLLYVQATSDKLVPRSCLAEIRSIRPDVRVAQIVGPHLILQREPKQSADVVAKFIHELL